MPDTMTPLLPSLVDAQTLAEYLAHPAIRVFDASVNLIRPPEGGPYTVEASRTAYEADHIPGSAFADIPGALSDPTSSYPFTLPPDDHFAAAAGALGIGAETHVVAYSQASPMWATRLWWLLRFFGFDAVSVLDGGLPAWRAAGLPLDDAPASYPPAVFTAAPRLELLATKADVEAIVRAGGRTSCLVNTLTPPVFRGEGISSYSRAGRIPTSVNAPWTQLIDPQTNRFRAPGDLRAELEHAGALGNRPTVAYCGGGISATVDVFALALLGVRDARLYDGSLTEWTADPSLPVETG
jgi:thiosulfate/3-mercaptopyruvate sulfurtransferase